MKDINRLLIIIFSIFIAVCGDVYAQVSENFTDADFTSNPVWTGDDTEFMVNGTFELQLNATVAGRSYLSTPSEAIENAVWEFRVLINNTTSSANLSEVYLVSDAANIEGSLNGYFVRVGNTADEVSLYKQTGTTKTMIIDGVDGTVVTSANNIMVKATRDALGNWELLIDNAGGTTYVSQGVVFDNTHLSSSFFGLTSLYSVSNITKYLFDDITVTGSAFTDNIAPTIDSLVVISSTEIDVYFSENLDQTSAEAIGNYSLDNSIGNPSAATQDGTDLSLVHLTFSTAFSNGTNYTLTVSNVTDVNSNPIATANESFFYFVEVAAEKKDIVFNEIFPDPSPVIGLPGFEFVELFNASNKIFNLKDWSFVNSTTAKTIGKNVYLLPDSFVIFCSISDTSLFKPYGLTYGISSWTALTNTGDSLTLTDKNGKVIDWVSYKDSWYKDDVKKGGGYSLELINPTLPCGNENNWIASNDVTGGTPGEINSVFNNTPDVMAPTISSYSLLSADSIRVVFSETMDSLSLATATYAINGGLFVQNEYLSLSLDALTLSLSSVIDTAVNYTITITGATDCAGNNLTSILNFVIGYSPEKDSIIINEIYPDPNPSIGLPDFEYAEIFNRSTKLYDLSGCEFTGTYFPNNTFLAPGEYMILCAPSDTASFSMYGENAGLSGWSSTFLTNGGKDLKLIKENGVVLDRVFYDISWYKDAAKDDGGWSLERINPYSVCTGENNWKASIAGIGGTPGSENAVFSDLPDNISPSITSLQMLSDSSFQLYFSETMDSLSLVNGIYTINNGISVSSFVIDASLLEMTVFLSPSIDTSVFYLLSVSGLSDCPGNAMVSSNHQIFIGYQPLPGEIIITEIFADPTPEVGLPSVEYVEIFNKTNKLLDLSACEFSGATFLSNAVLEPNQYLILCSINDTIDLTDYNPKTGLNSWSSTFLTNSGRDLVLVNETNQIIDSVSYNLTWYNNTDKDDGGWSLEKVNLFSDCNYSNNWKASEYYLGGTPGWQNSVYSTLPDTAKPTILDVVVNSDSTISVYFSEPMDSSSLSITTISFENFISAEFASMTIEDEFKILNIEVSSSFSIGDYYTLVLPLNGKDCAGNILNGHKFTFIRGEKPSKGDLIINEIFSDPSPVVGLPEAEFVEVYNRSEKLIDLNGVEFEGAAISKNMLFPGEYLILCDDDDANSFAPFGKVSSIVSWSTLTNAGEDIRLTFDTVILDRVIYSDDWFEDEGKKGGGWTLERINPQTDCNFSNNWKESSDATGGTPGRINSVHSLVADIIAPGIEKIWVLSSNVIQVNFTESMDSLKLISANYSFTPFNSIDSISYANMDYTSLFITLTEALSVGVENTLSITNLSDCEGNEIASPSLRVFVMPENGDAGDLLINEVLFDPNTGGDDFVEIYNHSEKYIDLSKWKITNADFIEDSTDYKSISFVQVVLAPNEYMVITKDSSDIKLNYPNGRIGRFVQVETLPTFSNSEGTVILLNNENYIADRFDYEDNMHFSLLNSTKGVSLERLDFDRETNEKTNWHSAAEDVGFATPGYQNSQFKDTEDSNDEISLEPEIFSPDNDGYNDVLNISYKFSEAGNVATILIFDTRGRMVRTLKQNELLGISGTFSWDGILDNTEKARVGAYVVYLEVFDAAGNVKHFKEPCVVATKF